jgi:hypothetical protein
MANEKSKLTYDKKRRTILPKWAIDELDTVKAENAELKAAIKAMFAACDEWAAEFTQKKRAMDWGVVNNAYMRAEKALKGGKIVS